MLLVSPRRQELTNGLLSGPAGADALREPSGSDVRLVITADPGFSHYFHPEPAITAE